MNMPTQILTDYSLFLETYGVPYTQEGFYYQVGTPVNKNIWVLQISSIQSGIVGLLEAVIPYLVQIQVPFRLIQNENISNYSLQGSLGSAMMGVILSVYPENDQFAEQCAIQLIELTGKFKGPSLAHTRYLGSTVYTRYANPYDEEIVEARKQFQVPKGINWPFDKIAQPMPRSKPKLLNRVYYPIKVLKPDAKGQVIKAIYFKRFYKIKYCIIKQGIADMNADEHGRDIRDRLKWQYKLYQDLKTVVPMPEIFEYFEMDNDSYLAMQYIDGITLTHFSTVINKEKSWRHLSRNGRLKMTKAFLDIIEILEKMHEKGYIHRDVQPDNFMIDKKGNISVIDLELTWNSHKGIPDPPYQIGTKGHMSPQQLMQVTPVEKDDVYGLGALILNAMSNMPAVIINCQDVASIEKSILFFTGHEAISQTLARCFEPEPAERPSLASLKQVLSGHRDALLQKTFEPKAFDLDAALLDQQIEEAIIKGINGLALPILTDGYRRWCSPIMQKEVVIGNPQVGMDLYESWHSGISGPLWVVAQCKKLKYSTKSCQASYIAGWEWIQGNNKDSFQKIAPGLFDGSGGVGRALCAAFESGLIDPTPESLELLAECFYTIPTDLTLCDGVAGMGIALLDAEKWLNPEWTKNISAEYIQIILKAQLIDGSWPQYVGGNAKDIAFGLRLGVSGIILYLLNYLSRHEDIDVRNAIEKGLAWLYSKAHTGSGYIFWTDSIQGRILNPWDGEEGVSGIVLCYIRAYNILKNEHYRMVAEKALDTLPRFPAIADRSLGSGLSGVADVYLEAYRVFGNECWLRRVEWILSLLLNTKNLLIPDALIWQVTTYPIPTANLFDGSSGIIHLLLRHRHLSTVNHPLLI